MLCSCGLTVPWTKAPATHACMSCGNKLTLDTDDVLLHGLGAPGRETRPGQVEMGRLVDKVIKEKALAIIEGPVGSGKSDGYGVPSVLSGKRIVIATAKKQLQHQIARKDIPFIGERLGKDINVSLLKGKSNYACRLKLYDIPEAERKAFEGWLLNSEYGDITDYPGKKPFFWYDVTAEDCLGVRCKFANDCGYWRAKQQSKVAQVVIANHHVVAFDLRFGPRKLLGEYDTLIIDEAHQAEAAFRSAYAATISPYGVKRIIQKIDDVGLNTGLEKRLEDTWTRMFKAIENQDGEIPANPFGAAGDEALEILQAMDKAAKDEMPEGEEGDEDSGAGPTDSRGIKLEMLRKALARPIAALKEAKEPGENTVVYITTSDKKAKTVNVAPISIGPIIGPKLQMIPSVIITSATIAINGGFDDIKRRLGLDYKPYSATAVPNGPVSPAQAAAMMPTESKPVHELVLESPFDYNRQALLYTPKHIPLPVGPVNPQYDDQRKVAERERYIRILSQECARLIRVSKGNAFILFTSTQDLKDVHTLLLEDVETPLIPQGDDAESALKEFTKTPNSTILGLKSFWEGVDVVGDKLRLVIITKLPFPMLSDPVQKARERQMIAAAMARGTSESTAKSSVFNAIQIPIMLTDLRQGAGRLIRSKSDKGVLAILDCRVWTGSGKKAATTERSYSGYGALAVNAIGFNQRVSDFAVVERVFGTWFKE